jgi:hypothetical protein
LALEEVLFFSPRPPFPFPVGGRKRCEHTRAKEEMKETGASLSPRTFSRHDVCFVVDAIRKRECGL